MLIASARSVAVSARRQRSFKKRHAPLSCVSVADIRGYTRSHNVNPEISTVRTNGVLSDSSAKYQPFHHSCLWLFQLLWTKPTGGAIDKRPAAPHPSCGAAILINAAATFMQAMRTCTTSWIVSSFYDCCASLAWQLVCDFSEPSQGSRMQSASRIGVP